MSIISEIQNFSAGAIIDLFEIDATELGGEIFRFHNSVNGLLSPVVWQRQTYTPYPIEASGFELNSKGSIPRPTLRSSNIAGSLTQLLQQYNDLIGAKVTRKRTFYKFLDPINYSGNTVTTEILANTEFLNSDSWVLGTGWSISGGSLNYTGAQGNSAYTDVSIHPNTDYTITIDSEVSSSGGVDIIVTNGTDSETVGSISTIGEFVFNFNTGDNLYDRLRLQGTGINALGQIESINMTFESANPEANPNSHFPDEVYFIDRKTLENGEVVELELTAPWDVTGTKLPGRQIIQNTCPWVYRGAECGYAGDDVADSNDNIVGTPEYNGTDACSKRVAACQLRFGENASLPFGGFPGAGKLRN